VYLRNARLKGSGSKEWKSELPPIHLAQRDISTPCHPPRFKAGLTSHYTQHEVILHDGHDVETLWALDAGPHDNVLAYDRRGWRFRPWYFTLFYTAAIGDRLLKVFTKYSMPNQSHEPAPGKRGSISHCFLACAAQAWSSVRW
jgi:hypothetical protein